MRAAFTGRSLGDSVYALVVVLHLYATYLCDIETLGLQFDRFYSDR